VNTIEIFVMSMVY